MRLLFLICLFACLQVLLPLSARASDGIRIMVIREQEDDSWLVSEFIDNSILDDMARDPEGNVISISPGLSPKSDSPASTSVISGRSRPLVVFAGEHVNPLEERLVESGRAQIERELDRELTRQVVSGLFQVPFWPYLAASEIPMRRVDIQRGWRLHEYRPGSFSAAAYASTGDVGRWDVSEMTSNGILIEKIEGSGEGLGISMEYIASGEMSDFHFIPDAYSGVFALYIDNGAGFVIDGMRFSEVDVDKISGALENPLAAATDGALVSAMETNDEHGHTARMLLIPGGLREGAISFINTSGTDAPETARGIGIGMAGSVIICWISFGLLVLAGHWFFPFSGFAPLELVSRAIAVYPLYLLIAMLTAGIWGMGFIIGAAGVSRFIAPEGRRQAAMGVVLAASFGIAVISWIIVR